MDLDSFLDKKSKKLAGGKKKAKTSELSEKEKAQLGIGVFIGLDVTPAAHAQSEEAGEDDKRESKNGVSDPDGVAAVEATVQSGIQTNEDPDVPAVRNAWVDEGAEAGGGAEVGAIPGNLAVPVIRSTGKKAKGWDSVKVTSGSIEDLLAKATESGKRQKFVARGNEGATGSLGCEVLASATSFPSLDELTGGAAASAKETGSTPTLDTCGSVEDVSAEVDKMTSSTYKPPVDKPVSGVYRPPTEKPTSGAYRPPTDKPATGAYKPPTDKPFSGAYRPPADKPSSGAYRPTAAKLGEVMAATTARDETSSEKPAVGAYRPPIDKPSSGAYKPPVDKPSSGAYKPPTDKPSLGAYKPPSEKPASVPAVPAESSAVKPSTGAYRPPTDKPPTGVYKPPVDKPSTGAYRPPTDKPSSGGAYVPPSERLATAAPGEQLSVEKPSAGTYKPPTDRVSSGSYKPPTDRPSAGAYKPPTDKPSSGAYRPPTDRPSSGAYRPPAERSFGSTFRPPS